MAAPTTTPRDVQNSLLRLAFMLATVNDTLARPISPSALNDARKAPATSAHIRNDTLQLAAQVKKATTSFSLAVRPEANPPAPQPNAGPLDGLHPSSLAAADQQIKLITTDYVPKLVFVAQKARADGAAGVGAGNRWATNVASAVQRVTSTLASLVEASMDTNVKNILAAASAQRDGRPAQPPAPALQGSEARDLMLRTTGEVWAACDGVQPSVPADATSSLTLVLRAQQAVVQDALAELREGLDEINANDPHLPSSQEQEPAGASGRTTGAEADQDELDALMGGNTGLEDRLELGQRSLTWLEQCDAWLTLLGKALKLTPNLGGAAVDEAAAAVDEVAAKVDDAVDGILRGKDECGLGADALAAQLGGVRISTQPVEEDEQGDDEEDDDDSNDDDDGDGDDAVVLQSIRSDLQGICSAIASAANALEGTKPAARMQKEAEALIQTLETMATDGLFQPPAE